MEMQRILVAVLATGWLVFSQSVSATPISITVSGHAENVDPVFSPLVSPGDPMSGVFVYDTSAVTRVVEFDAGRRHYYSPLLDFQLTIGGVSVSGVGGRAEVTDNYIDSQGRIWDRFILESGGAEVTSPELQSQFNVNVLSVYVSMTDFADADALSSIDLPEVLNVGSFDAIWVSIQMELAGGNFQWLPMFARVDNVRIQPVTEPAPFLLLFAGLVEMSASRRLVTLWRLPFQY